MEGCVSVRILLERTYVFLTWFSERVPKFPKDHKYTLGNRLRPEFRERPVEFLLGSWPRF